jgi:uracil phosphoribosyltransferase
MNINFRGKDTFYTFMAREIFRSLMQIHNLSEKNSVLNHFLGEIRDVNYQLDRLRFRRNIERIGEIMAYEISKSLSYSAVDIQTPLDIKSTHYLLRQQVICSVLRAGLPLHTGFLNYFDRAESGFISAYRQHEASGTDFKIVVSYEAVPDLSGKSLFLVDPMLATGQSIVAVFNKLMQHSTPQDIHVAVVIAAPEGIAYLKKHMPDTCNLWVACIDERLNHQQYIIPGLGDAGDLAFGTRL